MEYQVLIARSSALPVHILSIEEPVVGRKAVQDDGTILVDVEGCALFYILQSTDKKVLAVL